MFNLKTTWSVCCVSMFCTRWPLLKIKSFMTTQWSCFKIQTFNTNSHLIFNKEYRIDFFINDLKKNFE